MDRFMETVSLGMMAIVAAVLFAWLVSGLYWGLTRFPRNTLCFIAGFTGIVSLSWGLGSWMQSL